MRAPGHPVVASLRWDGHLVGAGQRPASQAAHVPGHARFAKAEVLLGSVVEPQDTSASRAWGRALQARPGLLSLQVLRMTSPDSPDGPASAWIR